MNHKDFDDIVSRLKKYMSGDFGKWYKYLDRYLMKKSADEKRVLEFEKSMKVFAADELKRVSNIKMIIDTILGAFKRIKELYPDGELKKRREAAGK